VLSAGVDVLIKPSSSDRAGGTQPGYRCCLVKQYLDQFGHHASMACGNIDVIAGNIATIMFELRPKQSYSAASVRAPDDDATAPDAIRRLASQAMGYHDRSVLPL
jgi:hypothetical protein